MTLLLLCTEVAAGTVDAWAIDDFGSESDTLEDEGWTAGYSDDPWYVLRDGSAISLTDDYATTEDYDVDGPQDNWIVTGDEIGDGLVRADMFAYDDDAAGVAARVSRDGFYALVYSEDSSPPPVWGVDEGTLMLLRIEDGEATVLALDEASRRDTDFELELSFDGGLLIGSLDGDEVLKVEDDDPLPPGQAGLYAYNSGYGEGGAYSGSTEIEVFWLDRDDDGVPNDIDNCIDDANEDQADLDDDGIGSACDDDEPEPPDTDPQDSTPPDDAPPPLEASCGCTAATPASGAALAALLGLMLLRRRDR